MAADEISFHVKRRPVPKGSVSGFPIARATCEVCAAARPACPTPRETTRACGGCSFCLSLVAVPGGPFYFVPDGGSCLRPRPVTAPCDACPVCTAPRACGRKNCYGGKIIGVQIADGGGRELEAWEGFVRSHATAARDVAGWQVVEKPSGIAVEILFLLERPDTHLRERGGLSAEGLRKPVPIGRPDWDKLARAACDALTGCIVQDDSQIVLAHVGKAYSAGAAGMIMVIRRVAREPEWMLAMLRRFGLAQETTQGSLL